MSETTDHPRVIFRPMASAVLGGFVVLIAAVLVADTIRRGSGAGAWALSSGLVFGGLVVWVTSVRPAVIAEPTRLVVRNPLRDVVIPWAAVDDMRLRFQLDVHVDDDVYHAWGVPVTTRTRLRQHREQIRQFDVGARVGDQAREYAAKERPPTFAERARSDLALIREQRKATTSPDEPVEVHWSWPYIGAMAAAVVVFVVALLL